MVQQLEEVSKGKLMSADDFDGERMPVEPSNIETQQDNVVDEDDDSKLTKKYDIIVDRGLVHNLFHLENRNKYFEMIGNITHEKSYILLKVMSPYETRFHPLTHSGPYRFTEKQLVKFFMGFKFKCVQLKDTFFYSNIQPYLRGYFCVYKKEESN